MKKYLLAMSLLTISIANLIQTKEAVDKYEVPNMKITMDHKQYLNDVKEKIKANILNENNLVANELVLWSINYIKEFHQLKNSHQAKQSDVADISNFEAFINNTKKYLNQKELSVETSNKIMFLETRINELHNTVQDAVANFAISKIHSEKFELEKIIKKYDICWREYSKVITIPELQNNLSLKIQEKLITFKSTFKKEIKNKMVHYIKLFLDAINNNLNDCQKNLKEVSNTVSEAQKVTNLHMQYLEIKSLITLLKNENISNEFYSKIVVINKTLITLKTALKTKEDKLINLWKNFFDATKKSLNQHNDKIEDEGEWEKIEQLLEDFKTNVKEFNNFKNKNQDLKLDTEEVAQLIKELKTIFTKITYRGITKNNSHGTWSEWYLSETQWNSYKLGTNTSGIVAPVATGLAFETAHRVYTRKTLVRVPTMTIEITGRRFSQIISNKVYFGAWVGLAIGLGLVTIPSSLLAYIKTKGAGLSFKYNYFGYLTAMLAPTIEIYKTGKPQEMKYLNIFDIEDEK